MDVIKVHRLTKFFRVYKKEPGLKGSIRSLFKRSYEDAKAVNNISFSIKEGELIGFIGPNGAGKTTTLKCLSGLLYPTSGTISVLGYTPFDRKSDFLRQIGLVMGQKNQLWWDLPPMESFLLNKEIYNISDNRFKETLAELTELMEIKDILSIQVRKLSLGQRMKCELVAQLIHSPKILFLDEPTIGLDVVMQQKLRQFIKQYNKQHHATIILTSHYMEDVKQLCDRVLIIDHGKLLYDGRLAEIAKQFSENKLVTIILEQPQDYQFLSSFSPVKSYQYPEVTFTIQREQTTAIIGQMLKQLPIKDMNIQETDIEDVIRQIFTQHK